MYMCAVCTCVLCVCARVCVCVCTCCRLHATLFPFLFQGHKPGSEEEIQTLTLITFIRKLYSQSSFPEFVMYAQQPEFVESLVMTLFSPPSEWCVCVCVCVCVCACMYM